MVSFDSRLFYLGGDVAIVSLNVFFIRLVNVLHLYIFRRPNDGLAVRLFLHDWCWLSLRLRIDFDILILIIVFRLHFAIPYLYRLSFRVFLLFVLFLFFIFILLVLL